jgi:hypothetical protein
MTGVLLITDTDMERIKIMIAEARRHVVPWAVMAPTAVADDKPTLMLADRKAGPPHPPVQRIQLGTYDCALSFEEQPAGIMRHLSVSSARAGRVPNPLVMSMIAEAFGYSQSTVNIIAGRADVAGPPCRAWFEEFKPGHMAFNLIELVEPAPPGALQ